jgi:hypothetical protein
MADQTPNPLPEDETLMSLSDSGHALTGDDELPAGLKVGKYRIQKLIGRGGMGAVYRAMDTLLQREVALKVLPRELTEDEQALRRFLREAQLAARLNHTNAVTVYDVGRKGAIVYIAMELVRGTGCDELLRQRGKLSVDEATRLVADACRALGAAHAAGLIHRDIKPANILRDADGVIKIGDFGLAKLHTSSDATLTAKDMVIGTPKYMSPEQCNNQPVDARTDLYALGATYYALLTGSAPFDEGTTMQILFAHCSAPVPDPRTLDAALPETCTAIIHRAMAKAPEDRYPSAEAMLADLNTLLTGGATPGDAPADASALAGMFASLEVPAEAAADKPLPVASKPKRTTLGLIIGGAVAAAVVAGVIVSGVLVWTAATPREADQLAAAPPVPSEPSAEDAPESDAAPPPTEDVATAAVASETRDQTPPPLTTRHEPEPEATADMSVVEPASIAPTPSASPEAENTETGPTPAQMRAALAAWLRGDSSGDDDRAAATETATDAASDQAPPAQAPEAEPEPEPDEPAPVPPGFDGFTQTRFERMVEAYRKAEDAGSHSRMRTALRALENFHRQYARSPNAQYRALADEAKAIIDSYDPPRRRPFERDRDERRDDGSYRYGDRDRPSPDERRAPPP